MQLSLLLLYFASTISISAQQTVCPEYELVVGCGGPDVCCGGGNGIAHCELGSILITDCRPLHCAYDEDGIPDCFE